VKKNITKIISISFQKIDLEDIPGEVQYAINMQYEKNNNRVLSAFFAICSYTEKIVYLYLIKILWLNHFSLFLLTYCYYFS